MARANSANSWPMEEMEGEMVDELKMSANLRGMTRRNSHMSYDAWKTRSDRDDAVESDRDVYYEDYVLGYRGGHVAGSGKYYVNDLDTGRIFDYGCDGLGPDDIMEEIKDKIQWLIDCNEDKRRDYARQDD